MKAVVIRGPENLFPQLLTIPGINVDHAQSADVAGEHLLSAYATDDAITAIQALGLTVDVEATEADEQALLAQVIQEGGDDVTRIDIG